MFSRSTTRIFLLLIAVLLIVSCSEGEKRVKARTAGPQTSRAADQKATPKSASDTNKPSAGKKADPGDPPYNNGVTKP